MKCLFCFKSFKTEEAYINHLKKVHDIEADTNGIDYDLLLFLTRDIPEDLLKNPVRQHIPTSVKRQVERRDRGKCALCGRYKKFNIHHRIPNGDNSLDNLYTLCLRCHYIVHILLYLDGKWKNPGFRR